MVMIVCTTNKVKTRKTTQGLHYAINIKQKKKCHKGNISHGCDCIYNNHEVKTRQLHKGYMLHSCDCIC